MVEVLMGSYDFVAVGHVTVDLFPDGSARSGGTALYAAVTAERLGLRAAVLTAGRSARATIPQTIEVVGRSDVTDSTFENRGEGGPRQQWLHARAPSISASDVPAALRGARMVLLGPVCDEVDMGIVAMFPGAQIAATPQGWMRAWTEPLPSAIVPRPFSPSRAFLARLTALVLSLEDVAGDEARAADYAAHCPLVALTRGSAGATLYVEGRAREIAPCAAQEIDATGAGDVFAAALLIGLDTSRDAVEAARFAARVAARSVEGPGVEAIPTRAQLP